MNLIEGLQQEANRRRELLKKYEAIGPAGIFGATFLKIDIERAEKAIAGNDIFEMIAVYKELSEEDIE